MDFILRFLQELLDGFIDSFKMKNAKVFAFVVFGLLFLNFAADWMLNYINPETGEFFIVEPIRGVLKTGSDVILILLTLLGAHTPETAKKRRALEAEVLALQEKKKNLTADNL